MALLVDFKYKDISVLGGYVRVEKPYMQTKALMTCEVSYRATEQSTEPLLSKAYSGIPYSMAGGNPWEQCYAFLKQHQDFSGAVDV
jgi:hypothetical protein